MKLKNLIYILLIVILLAGIYFAIKQTPFFNDMNQIKDIRLQIIQFGLLGPLIIIVTMMLAVIVNPLPSAPIAMAAGAVYGHTWGTIYIIIGALLGAIGAFLIARLAGYEFIKKYIGDKLPINHWSSQNKLMGIIFLSRLMPFLSFDLMSYAAGLTPITLWRFVIATLLGLIPISFLLAHFGGEAAELDTHILTLVTLSMAAVTIIPILVTFFKNKTSTNKISTKENT